jgi:hypothetical protein
MAVEALRAPRDAGPSRTQSPIDAQAFSFLRALQELSCFDLQNGGELSDDLQACVERSFFELAQIKNPFRRTYQ